MIIDVSSIYKYREFSYVCILTEQFLPSVSVTQQNIYHSLLIQTVTARFFFCDIVGTCSVEIFGLFLYIWDLNIIHKIIVTNLDTEEIRNKFQAWWTLKNTSTIFNKGTGSGTTDLARQHFLLKTCWVDSILGSTTDCIYSTCYTGTDLSAFRLDEYGHR